MTTTTITLGASDFRVFERLDWSPVGTTLLVGPNGAGKTTALDVLLFLRTLFDLGHERALGAVDGRHFKRLGSDDQDPVTFEVTVGELTWTLRLPMSSIGLSGTFGEELRRGDTLILRAAMFGDFWHLGDERLALDDHRCCARVLWDRGESPWMEPLVDALTGIRVYKSYWLNHVKRSEPVDARASILHGTARNLWSVLASWRGSPTRHGGRFAWVMEEIRRAFPGVVDRVEFDRGLPFLFGPAATDPADGLPPSRAADGLLTGLAHLVAVAGAPRIWARRSPVSSRVGRIRAGDLGSPHPGPRPPDGSRTHGPHRPGRT